MTQLMNEAPSPFRKTGQTTNEDVERIITQTNSGRLLKKYRRNIIRNEF